MAVGAAKKIVKKKKSVLKRIALTATRAQANLANRTRVRTMMKRLRGALGAGNAAVAQTLLSPTMSAIDRAIQKGILSENTANRYKSRLTLACNAVATK